MAEPTILLIGVGTVREHKQALKEAAWARGRLTIGPFFTAIFVHIVASRAELRHWPWVGGSAKFGSPAPRRP